MVGQQIADIADTLQLKDVAMATIFWLSIYGVHIGATWRIRLNCPCAAVMRPYVKLLSPLFSKRELTFTFAICYRPSVCRLSSVTFVRPTQAVQIFDNVSTVFGTLAIR